MAVWQPPYGLDDEDSTAAHVERVNEMPRRNRRYSASSHIQPMADGRTQKASRKWGDDTPKSTTGGEITVRRITPRARLSHDEIKERMLYGGITRQTVEPKRAWR